MLTNKLQEHAITHLKTLTGCDDWSYDGDFITARQCNVYKLTSKELSKNIALKVYHNNTTSKQLKGQYKALEYFANNLNTKDKQYRTPETYGCFEQHNFFLMEWISAPSLDYTLWRYFYHRNRQQSAIKDSYRWLKHYHKASVPTSTEVNLSYYQQRLIRSIELYNGQEFASSNQAFKEGLETIKKMSERFKSLKTDHAYTHGDFTPTNILIGENQTTGIDIGGHNRKPVEDDIALLLNYISIDFFNMLPQRQLKKPITTWSILNLTLDSYHYPKDNEHRAFFTCVYLYQTLRRWLIINNRNHTKSRLIDRWRITNSENIVKALNRVLR